jgi:hypothetical protein
MTYHGWIKLERTILSDLYEGRITINEFAALTILRLLADRRTGGYKINASALVTFTGSQLNVDAADRALRTLEAKKYIKRKTSRSHEVYPYLVNGYLVTDGKMKSMRLNSKRQRNYTVDERRDR